MLKVETKKKQHGEMIDDAYNQGFNDAKNGYVYRFSSLICVCNGCQIAYKMGYETGQKLKTETED